MTEAGGPARVARRSPPGLPGRLLGRVVLVLSLGSALVVAPALPAGWRGLTHLAGIGNDGQGELGTLTVATCPRESPVGGWTCQGRFQVNDPMAEPYPDVDGVTLENDPRAYPSGTRLDVTKALTSTRAYRWGTVRQLRTVALWLGLLASLTAAAASWGPRRRSGWWPALLAVLGLLLLLGAQPWW